MLYVARKSFSAEVEGMDKTKGITPEYEIKPEIDDLIDGCDSALEFAGSLIQKMHRNK